MFWTFFLAPILAGIVLNKSVRKWAYIIFKTLPRDLKGMYVFGKVNLTLHQYARNGQSIPKLFKKIVEKHPNKIAFHYEDQSWTFQELEDFSNKVANFFRNEGYQRGDSIAILLDNRPDYVGLWLGLSKIGVISALINTNLVSAPLVHSISAACSKGIIYASDFECVINGIKEKIKEMKLYRYNTSETQAIMENAVDLKSELEHSSSSSPNDHIKLTKITDKVIYIYTSGTTGLPKAANISHARFLFATVALYNAADLNVDDIFYNPLPLYHSAGGMVAVGQTLVFGVTNVIRKKFSATNFWVDCKKYKCTVANYIGELCRYLLATHKDPVVDHSVKKMTGNGLRRDIWVRFQKHFNISRIIEFYGSTEGNANIVNIDNTVGAVGFLPRFANSAYPVSLIKCDDDTKEPIRDSQGLCIRCKPGEPGIFIGKIIQKNAINEFTGYADKKDTNKKTIANAFKKGDLYFNTGDIMVQDELGYFYFKDRTGDTFRWKGENVATNEVESVITSIIGPKEIAVYGVEVPNTEGKAGMMTILDPQKSVNIDDLAKSVKEHLPGYAIPLFLRIADSLPMTGTFKVKKVELQREGFNMEKIKDTLYFYDMKTRAYIPLGEVYANIMSGKMKL